MSRVSKSSAKKTSLTRDESKLETRRALIAAAIQTFAEEGLDAPSLDAICERAGKTRGAFYVHFRDRDELLLAVMEDLIGGFVGAVIASGRSAGDLESAVRVFLKLAQAPQGLPGSRVPLHQFLAACARNDQLRTRFEQLLAMAVTRLAEVIRTGQTKGKVRDDAKPSSIGVLLVAMVTGLYVMREQGVPLSLPQLGEELLRLLSTEHPGRSALDR